MAISARAPAQIAAGMLLVCFSAFALNPALDVNQYAHKSWTIRDGFFKGRIESIAQTPDGYLWLGTVGIERVAAYTSPPLIFSFKSAKRKSSRTTRNPLFL